MPSSLPLHRPLPPRIIPSLFVYYDDHQAKAAPKKLQLHTNKLKDLALQQRNLLEILLGMNLASQEIAQACGCSLLQLLCWAIHEAPDSPMPGTWNSDCLETLAATTKAMAAYEEVRGGRLSKLRYGNLACLNCNCDDNDNDHDCDDDGDNDDDDDK